MEDKAKNKLMRKTKSELIEIIIKKDKTEIALRNDIDGTLKSLADTKQAVRDASDKLNLVALDKERMDEYVKDLENSLAKWQDKSTKLETQVETYTDYVKFLETRCSTLKNTTIAVTIFAIVFFASFIVSL
jgi:DNA repair exonuclease SbcCD ATPase subunit